MVINIEIDENELKQLVIDALQEKLGDIPIDIKKVSIQVKSKQNYKSEWETASFKATYSHDSRLP